MTTAVIAYLAVALAATPAEQGEAMFKDVENLARSKQPAQALAKAEQAVAELDKAHAAKERIGRVAMDGLRRASRLAHEDFLDHDKAMFFCDRMFRYADSDYWRTPARLEKAMVYRSMGDFKKAQEQYDAVAAGDKRHRAAGLLPQAEMVFFDMADRTKGRLLLEAAMADAAVNGRERFASLRRCAADAMTRGRPGEALAWYAMLEKLSFEKAQERDRFLSQAWYEMGRIEESLGQGVQAKAHYRRAMELTDGEMRYRTRARDALESIEYFE